MSRYHGSKICGSQQQAVFCNGDGEQQKAIGLDWQKNNFFPKISPAKTAGFFHNQRDVQI